MIRIWRGKEPTDLATARRKYLARACIAWANGASARRQASQETLEVDGYNVARAPLYLAQHRKCAYCERQEGLANQPVEHFRPKGGADREEHFRFQLASKNRYRRLVPPEIDGDHYFWLAWSWENLFFSCTSCNGTGNKGNHFPLRDHSTKLPLPSRTLTLKWPSVHFDRKSEKAMLVDPSHEDPMNFIQWLPENPSADWKDLRWLPQGRDPEERGDATIAILGLRRDLPEQVSAHIQRNVVPKMKWLRDAGVRQDRHQADQVWDQVEMMFHPMQPYLAATYDTIEWFLEQMGLADLHAFIGRKFEDLRPGARDDEVPSVDLPDPPECHSLPVELVLQVRAEMWTANEAVLAMCSHIAWDDLAVLARVLGYAEGTVRSAGGEWVKSGQLARTAGGGFGAVTQ